MCASKSTPLIPSAHSRSGSAPGARWIKSFYRHAPPSTDDSKNQAVQVSSTQAGTDTACTSKRNYGNKSLDDKQQCCHCGRDMKTLREELNALKSELYESREIIKTLRERETQLRERLSEQARLQFEKGTTKFEDINLGLSRPTQLVRRYNNLYNDTRLEALEALDQILQVSQFNNLKGKLLLSVIVLAFRNARKKYDEIKVKVKQLLHIPEVTRASSHMRFARGHGHIHKQSGISTTNNTDSKLGEIDDIISFYLRKSVDKCDLRQNYEEVCERVWTTLVDFPSLSQCPALLRYLDESVRLAWAMTIQNPPLAIDYDFKQFDPDLHTRFHSADPTCDVIRCFLWPVLREGIDGPCLHKGVVIT